MTKSNKILFSILAVLFLVVASVGYFDYFVRGDYLVTKQIPCDPKTESCFASDCETNDSTCDSSTTYKKISITSKEAGSNYDDLLSCPLNSQSCTIITCQDDSVEVGEKCFK